MNDLRAMAGRVRNGDAEAAGQLRRELADAMGYMVRRALRGRRVRSPFARRVLAEVAAAGAACPGDDAAKRDELIDQITSRLCEDVFRNLCSDSESHHQSALLLAGGRTDKEPDDMAEKPVLQLSNSKPQNEAFEIKAEARELDRCTRSTLPPPLPPRRKKSSTPLAITNISCTAQE